MKTLERIADKSAKNLIDAIQDSKSRDLNRLIYALGIRHVGEHAAWLLASHYSLIEKLQHAGIGDLTRIEGIGPVMAESIYIFFQNKENLKILEKLKSAGVRMANAKTKETKGPLQGKSIVITGTLESYTRPEAEELIRRLGGNPSSGVSQNTHFLVCGKEPGSKLEKAKALGVKILTEGEFKKIAR